ncbi:MULTISPECIES: DUF3833 domain-containing protein [Asticcacaulis]|uniref:DUF3833 domain-containing protein n=1 Tax=Asticcacaulis TaxID=76890 RepID=UPI001AE34133|nr:MULTISPECIES: DUF3833 domain-containing protein [Asticcacaulis]MBP2160373.1 hypothetical protein [Asticcacaulis solisilvae]MDR6801324.1 hypothetical protein [Asticcacaulis sp. BE141]
MKRAGLILVTGLALCLSACATVDIAQNARPGPAFVLEDYFAGETRAYGVFEDRSGKVTRTFTVVTRGTARADGFTLDERFLWSDGERQSRTWTFTKAPDGSYRGTAGDVQGIAMLETRGDAMRLRYLLKLPNKGGSVDVRFDDWSHLVADGVAINRADVSKFGVSLGRVTLAFVKPGHPAPTAEMLRGAF